MFEFGVCLSLVCVNRVWCACVCEFGVRVCLSLVCVSLLSLVCVCLLSLVCGVCVS